MSSRMRAVCSTTRATGSDENEEIVGGGRTSSMESSVVSSAEALSWLFLRGTSQGGKLATGEIGASLKTFRPRFDNFLIDFDKIGDRVKEEEVECS